MAVVETVIAGVPFYQPYERPPEPQTLWRPIPRGLRGFTVHNGILDAKPSTDDQSLMVIGTLPNNYAYVLADVALEIVAVSVDEWEDTFGLNLQKFFLGRDIVGGLTWEMPFLLSGVVREIRSTGAVSKGTMYSGPMWADSDEAGVAMFLSAYNLGNSSTAAGIVNALISFWEFDLEQVRKYPINTPLPVHSR